MELAVKSFDPGELAGLRLRGLFESRGFRRVHVGKFEDYALYVDNKNFLRSESVITFMNSDGKLLALKPDVTLSVVRGVQKAELPALEKLYYIDEVYRLSRENRDYKVHNQIGIEIVGRGDGFSNVEAVDIALSSLSLISDSFVLDVSHLGFVSGLIERLDLSHGARRQLLSGIHSKSPHDIAAALDAANVCEEDKNRVLRLCGLHGDFSASLKDAKALIVSDRMAEAYSELERLDGALRGHCHAGGMRLDFSVVDDVDYYNGLIFLGYVEGLPNVVLTGGRYDNLLRKMGKRNGAIGFAVSLDDLNAYIKTEKPFDFDVLVTYPDDCDYAGLLSAVGVLRKRGESVRLESEASGLETAGFTWKRHFSFENGVLKEAASC